MIVVIVNCLYLSFNYHINIVLTKLSFLYLLKILYPKVFLPEYTDLFH